MGVAHVSLELGLWHQGGDAVHDNDVHGAAADEILADFQSLLGSVGLRNQQLLGVEPALGGVARVQRMLRVDVGGGTARSLCLRHDVVGQCRLTGRLGAVYLRHASAGDSSDAQGQIEGERPGGDRCDSAGVLDVAQPHHGAPPELAFDLSDSELQGFSFFLFRRHAHLLRHIGTRLGAMGIS